MGRRTIVRPPPFRALHTWEPGSSVILPVPVGRNRRGLAQHGHQRSGGILPMFGSKEGRDIAGRGP